MIKFHLTVLAVFGSGFFTGETPTVARRFPPFSPASLTLLGRASCEYSDGRVLSLPRLLIEDVNTASAFQTKASRSLPFEVGVR